MLNSPHPLLACLLADTCIEKLWQLELVRMQLPAHPFISPSEFSFHFGLIG
jgi:hypothetical protein